MKHKNKIQIAGLGLALALSQAVSAYAAGTVVVGKAPGETAAETTAAEATTESTVTAAPENTTTATTKAAPAVLDTPAHVVTAGSHAASDSPTPAPQPSTAAADRKQPSTVAADSTQSTVSAADIRQPEVAAEGAVLLNAATGEVLYGKNQDQQFYPASITKVMTALVVLEHCNLNETVTFSETATTNLESGAVALGVSAGDQLTVEQSLYGLLLKSANEIGNGLAEHVSGSVSAFAELMNAKAKELGC